MIIQQATDQEFSDYLRDESRRSGQADSICFPRCEEDVREAILFARGNGLTITTQGARTGVTGGCVPGSGLVVNLSRMNQIKGLRFDAESNGFSLLVEPGLTLVELRETLQKNALADCLLDEQSREPLERLRQAGPLMFTPDPTEASASLGGMAACNASGACSFRYAAMRPHILGLRLATGEGDVLDLRRRSQQADGRSFELHTLQGRRIAGLLPDLPTARTTKCAAGYWVRPGMDLIDLFIGAEGTLGIITGLELILRPAPPAITGVAAFLPDLETALRLVKKLRASRPAPAAIEFFDLHALDLLREQRENGHFTELPELRPGDHTALYIEYHADGDQELEEAMTSLCADLEESGGSEDRTWMADTPDERRRMHAFRHAVPESVNQLIAERKKMHPGLTKLGTDMAAPDDRLDDMMALYLRDLAAAGLEYVIFGHIGNNHVHVNILPRDPGDYEKGCRLYAKWAAQLTGWGGTVSAEHGIGKIKKPYLRIMFGDEELGKMREIKRLFDPIGLFNPGNLFDG